ncbi:MAG: hypothetical protein H8E55_33705 [Pelagibacterales bacterium]|nr:hypothetical protein [Pelagibacterales bacterium]
MRKYRKQKVRFHKGDRRPGNKNGNTPLTYRKRMFKKGKEILWRVIEHPTKQIVAEYFFEKDASALVRFQNKNKVWQTNGGIPKFLCIKASR